MMSLNFCLDAVVLACSNLYINYFLPSKFVHEFLKFAYEFFLLFSRIRMRFVLYSYAKFVIFDKLGKISYEFARIREGYVTNGLYCIFFKFLFTNYFHEFIITHSFYKFTIMNLFSRIRICKFMNIQKALYEFT